MSNRNIKIFNIFYRLIWKNKPIRNRIVFITVYFPLFILISIYISNLLEIKLRATYILIFLSGMFYHFFITSFSISAIHSYLKFLLINRLMLNTFILIYILGVLSSVINCLILVGLNSVNQFQFDIGQVIIAFLLSNFIFAPIGFWISSFDFVKINLFESKYGHYQPRPIYLATAIVFLLLFSLFLDARTEFGWQLNTILLFLAFLIVLIGISLKLIFKIIYLNFQNSIAE